MEALLEYWPTALVGLVVGIITQYVVRLGKRDEVGVQQAANRLQEVQQALDANEKYIERLNADFERERKWRQETEDENRSLRTMIVGEITGAANAAFPPTRDS